MSRERYFLVLDLAKRFVFSKTSDGFLSLISYVAVAGVALGVLALTLTLSVVNGYQNELVSSIAGLNGDVIFYTRDAPFEDTRDLRERIKRVVPEVKAMSPSVISEMMVSGPDSVNGALIEGVDLDHIGKVTRIPDRIIEGRMPEDYRAEVAIGSALAEKIGAKVGEKIRVIAPFIGTDTDGRGGFGQPKVVEVDLVGIVKVGMHRYDSKYVFTSLSFLQKFMKETGKITTLKLKIDPRADLERVVENLSDNFGYPFRARYWGQLNRNMLYAIELEKVVIAILLTAIIVVAAFNVVSTLMMMIHDKAKEIAIVKVMGFKKSKAYGLFSLIGLAIGLVGTLTGVGLGMGLGWIIDTTQLISLPADVYAIDFLPVVFRWEEIVLTGVFSMLISLVATIYPAYQVANRSPLDGLRYE